MHEVKKVFDLHEAVKKNTTPFARKEDETGLAVGAIPYVIDETSGAIRIVMHSKTSDAPENVKLGNSESKEISPSPLQLKRGETIGSYTASINSMTLPDGEGGGPQSIVNKFDVKSVIPLVVNSDEQDGSRLEAGMLYSVESLENATSVFGDGAATTFEIKENGDVWVTAVNIEGEKTEENVLIPAKLIMGWENGDDSARDSIPTMKLQNSQLELKPTVPAAALLRIVADFRKNKVV